MESNRFATRIDLRRMFPPARGRLTFFRGFITYFATFLIVFGYLQLAPDPAGSPQLVNFFQDIVLLTAIICIIRLAYDMLYIYLYDYSIELEHLTLSKGVFVRLRASFPVARINDVSIKRSFWELILGLATVDILTASPLTDSGLITGLSYKNALKMQSYLLALIETTLPNVKEENAAKAVDAADSPILADHLIHSNESDVKPESEPGKQQLTNP